MISSISEMKRKSLADGQREVQWDRVISRVPIRHLKLVNDYIENVITPKTAILENIFEKNLIFEQAIEPYTL